MLCARTVFRCFRAVEHFADRVTGAAGPYFIAIAVVLMSAGALCFFTIILPSLPFLLLTAPICFLIAANLFLHYLWVCTTPPGFTDEYENPTEWTVGWSWAKPSGRSQNIITSPAYVGKCMKCDGHKPERTHHCRICKRCILKYDHHCPVRINQCVGLYNERHFVLFMFYFVLSTACFSGFGYQQFFLALGIYPYQEWSYQLPPWVFVLVYLLSSVLCLAVAIMLSFHLWGVTLAETSVESHDFPVYRAKAKSRGTTFVNCYDLGKRQNLELFFNVGPYGQYSYLTLIFPLRISPYTNGRAWAKRPGLTRHHGIDASDELTDDEEHSIAP